MLKNSKRNIERSATIFNIQKYNIYDGPGIRTNVFFQGCPLRCKWCANPEGLEKKYRILYKRNNCIDCGACVSVCPVNKHSITLDRMKHEVNRDIDCIGCGKCIEICPKEALSLVGEAKTISEIIDIIEEDTVFYNVSGGGVTLSGGEVMMQPEAAISLLMACNQRGINTAIETCAYVKKEILLEACKYIDLVLFDLKHIDSDKHYYYTGVRNERILDNLKAILDAGVNTKVRMPLLKGVNDQENDIRQAMEFVKPFKNFKNFKGVDLLPYHKLGVNKYNQLDLEYQIENDPSLDEEELCKIEKWIDKYGIKASVIRH